MGEPPCPAEAAAVVTVHDRHAENNEAAKDSQGTESLQVIPAIIAEDGSCAQICTDCQSAGLLQRINVTREYSDVAAKRQVRAAQGLAVRTMGPCRCVRRLCARLCAARPCRVRRRPETSPCSREDSAADAWLPFSANDPGRGSYLSEDQAGAGNEHVPTPAEDLLAAVPGLTPEQIFSPNVDLTVVQALRGLGMPHAGHECACLFLHRRRITIRNMGGFRACMLDVWGGVDNGARRPLQWLAEQRVLHADGVHGCGVLFCASDRNDRLKAGSMMQAHQRNRTTLYRAVFERNGYVATDCFPYDVPVCYGKTMQTYAFSVYRGRTLKRPRSEA